MGQTKKRKYDRYTLAFKRQAVRLANHPDVMSKSIADALGIHPVMLYRWQMEDRRGELKENKTIKVEQPTPKRRHWKQAPVDSNHETELLKARKRIQELEKALASRDEELGLLKKAQRFFAQRKQKSSASLRRTGIPTK